MLAREKVFLGWIAILFIFIRSSAAADDKKVCIIADRECKNNEYIKFYLYSTGDQNTTNTPINLSGDIDENTFELLNQKGEFKSMKIMVHGATGDNLDEFNTSIRRAYYIFGETLLILSVEYKKLLDDLVCLDEGILNIPTIAKCAVQVIKNIISFIPSIEYLHGVAFSFGTQVLGYMATLMKGYNFKFDRITALEPPIPRMEHVWKFLDRNSAERVEVIHTNGGILGQMLPLGDVDFYFNGGVNQPGCEKHQFPVSDKCSHMRVFEYFAESIIYKNTDCGFFSTFQSSSDITDMSFVKNVGINENIKVKFGEYISNDVTGVYHLETNINPPYALKQCSDPIVKQIHRRQVLETLSANMPELEDAPTAEAVEAIRE